MQSVQLTRHSSALPTPSLPAGRKAEIAAAACQLTNIFLVCIAYLITASMSMTAVANMACDIPANACV